MSDLRQPTEADRVATYEAALRHGLSDAEAREEAWPQASPLDVHLLAEAMKVCNTKRTVEWNAPRVAAEYARLAAEKANG